MQHGCLAEARGTHNRIRGPRLNIQAEVLEQVLDVIFTADSILLELVRETDSFKLDSTLVVREILCIGRLLYFRLLLKHFE